jgi:hypothetical protein
MSFKVLLKDFLIRKLLQCRQIGKESMRNSILSSLRLASPTLCRSLMLIRKKGLLSVNIDTLLKLAYRF